MKSTIIAATVLAAAFSVDLSAAIDEGQMASFQAECRNYAREEGVSGDQMEEYLAQCVQDLASTSSEEPEASNEGESSE